MTFLDRVVLLQSEEQLAAVGPLGRARGSGRPKGSGRDILEGPMKRLLLVGLLALPCRASGDEWTIRDTGLQLLVATLQIVDWGQTGYGLDSCTPTPHGSPCIPVWEENLLLQGRPSRARLNLTIGAAVIGHAAIAYLLPRPWRTIWQGVAILFEVQAVAHNYTIGGLSMSFRF